MIALHVDSKVHASDAVKQKVILACARAARGVGRLMPVVFRGRVIAWLGWSFRDNCAKWTTHRPWMNSWVDRNGMLLGFQGVDDLIYQTTQNGQMRQLFWFKWHGGGSTSDFWSHLYPLAGFPNAGIFNGTAFTARQHDDNDQGVLWHGGNVSPKTKHVISSYTRASMATPAVSETYVTVLYDMVISYDQCLITPTGPTTYPMVNTLPALRYVGAGDLGLQVMGCQHVSTSGGAQFNAVTYTSIGGTSGQTCPVTLTQPGNVNTIGTGIAPATCFGYDGTAGQAGQILSIPLANGDTGVKQIDSLNILDANPSDSNDYILGYQLAWMPIYGGFDYTYAHDYVKQIPSLPRVRDGACLTLAMHFIGGTSILWHGGVNVAWA